jgi:transcriptional regulator with XRE-family HTH domain
MAEQGLTQQDVADRCGWRQPQVAAYLTGAKEPGVKNLAKLASAVGCLWRLTATPS